MNAKEYLKQYKRALERIETAERELAQLREQRSTISAKLDGMPRGSNLSDRTARLATRIADRELEVVRMQTNAQAKRREIVNTLDRLEDPTLHRLLYLRYIEGYKWETVGHEMYYSYQWVSGKLHDRALAAFQDILDNS